jgi:SAM-dependent methyltransferase
MGRLDMATPTVDPPRLAPEREPALAAYEEIASVYDVFTRAHDYERFLTVIEELALDHGLAGRDVLDVACGTGKSFMPLVRRGYHVTACDLSPAMVRIAREKCAGLADVAVADMRALPDLGRVDLVTCLDDSLNYLLTDDELGAALHGIQRALRPDGLVVFDLNSLHTYRTAFTQTFAADQEGIFFCWRGETSPAVSEGGQAVATLEAFVKTASGRWTRRCSRHVQRHHPRAIVSRLCADAGLEVLEVFGQHPGARLDAVPREDEHTKLLYLARRSSFGAR